MGWVVINTDACFNSYYELAGCGGILRDHNGKWISGFNCTVRVDNSTQVECWALLKALQWAWTMGYKKVSFQLDANSIVEWIQNPGDISGPIREAVEVCRSWIKREWNINFVYISRDCNKAADAIARIACSMKCEWMEFRDVPKECRRFLLDDSMKVNTNRG